VLRGIILITSLYAVDEAERNVETRDERQALSQLLASMEVRTTLSWLYPTG